MSIRERIPCPMEREVSVDCECIYHSVVASSMVKIIPCQRAPHRRITFPRRTRHSARLQKKWRGCGRRTSRGITGLPRGSMAFSANTKRWLRITDRRGDPQTAPRLFVDEVHISCSEAILVPYTDEDLCRRPRKLKMAQTPPKVQGTRQRGLLHTLSGKIERYTSHFWHNFIFFFQLP